MYEISLIAALFVYVTVLVYYSRTPEFNIYHPLLYYCLFHGFIFVFRPIVAEFSDFSVVYNLYQFTPTMADKTTVILASTLGFLSFAFFCLRSGTADLKFKTDLASEIERRVSVKPLYFAIVMIAPIAIYSLLTRYSDVVTSTNSMVFDRASGSFINTQSNGYMTDAQLALPALALIIVYVYRFRLISLLPLLAFALFRGGTGGRGPVVTALVSAGLLWLYQNRKTMVTPRVLLSFAGVVALFSALGADRGAGIRAWVAGEEAAEVAESQHQFLEGMDFANMEYFEYLVYVVPQRSNTYTYFLDNLQLFTEPVPRVFWPGKPAGAPFATFSLFDYGYPIGMTRSLPGQGWFSLGWLGVMIWCGLWGAGLGLLYRKWAESEQSLYQTLAYVLFVPTLVVTFRDGILLTAVKQNFWGLGPIVLMAVWARLLGLPKIGQIRKFIAARGAGAADKAEQPDRITPGPAHAILPPAVARRRAALAERQAHVTSAS